MALTLAVHYLATQLSSVVVVTPWERDLWRARQSQIFKFQHQCVSALQHDFVCWAFLYSGMKCFSNTLFLHMYSLIVFSCFLSCS